MDIYREINRNPSRRDLFSFGVIVLAGFAAIGAWVAFRSHRPALGIGLAAGGAAVFALSFVPPLGRLLYIGWMGLGLTIGLVTGPLIMGALFAVVVVPVALVLRLGRRDAMRRRIDRDAASYWEDYPGTDDPGSYIRQS